MASCATNLSPDLEEAATDRPLVIGRAVTVLLGPTTRWYTPAVRFIELINEATGERFQIEMQADDRSFVLAIPAGSYALSRVQVSEGPFMSMANLSIEFTVSAEHTTYVGTWRFGIDIPKYGRKILVSMIDDEQSRIDIEHRFIDHYPEWADRPVVTDLPRPSMTETRLYEVAPYPRYPRYFRRHWW
ncbi:MAG TPA: hypothetical protein VHQ67_03420 [Nitrospiraceae bacterium]|nr:hypothetical protein [Nitrospiraceae bacterium]